MEAVPNEENATMTFRFNALALLMLCGLLGGLTACKQPIASDTQTPALSTTEKTRFGSYNIHKRHGLGGWDQSSGPSEKALLQQLERNAQATSSPSSTERKSR
jgi:hypothetical protein